MGNPTKTIAPGESRHAAPTHRKVTTVASSFAVALPRNRATAARSASPAAVGELTGKLRAIDNKHAKPS